MKGCLFRNPCLPVLLAGLMLWVSGCAGVQERRMHTTAYCNCRRCCGWERGNWRYLKLDVWNRYVSTGARKGQPYDGRTASGTKPRQYNPGLVSLDSVRRPWMIPVRVVFFPWLLLPHDGTVAADTAYYPFGTRMRIPGYGWGVVEDRGSAIRGSNRIDLYHRTHRRALRWGVRDVEVRIER